MIKEPCPTIDRLEVEVEVEVEDDGDVAGDTKKAKKTKTELVGKEDYVYKEDDEFF